MLNNDMEHTTIKVSDPLKFLAEGSKEERIGRFHGVDRHMACSTISVLDREWVEVEFHPAVKDLKGYLQGLGPEDDWQDEIGRASCRERV